VHGLLNDLYGHQEWADALHWTALAARPGALEDPAIRERLHHIHLVQRAFLDTLRGRPFAPRPLESYAAMAEIRDEARFFHAEARGFVAGLDEAGLARRVRIPWFEDPPCEISVSEALTQAALHTHGHRAQNAARLRELGGAPPLSDLIVWYWQGRPAPRW
jgi:uncharacterized damage-inducible protein DinB